MQEVKITYLGLVVSLTIFTNTVNSRLLVLWIICEFKIQFLKNDAKEGKVILLIYHKLGMIKKNWKCCYEKTNELAV